jgi:hypothetical protein
MATIDRSGWRARANDHRTYAEEVGLLLSLVIVGFLALTLTSITLLQFFEVLPTGVSMVLILSMLVFGVVVGRAMFKRTFAIPSIYRSVTPIVRHYH